MASRKNRFSSFLVVQAHNWLKIEHYDALYAAARLVNDLLAYRSSIANLTTSQCILRHFTQVHFEGQIVIIHFDASS